ncbi:MAG: glutamate racemase [Actinomycetota bacterium]|nr:glutamate racemase [Actinomycetota bacterium]
MAMNEKPIGIFDSGVGGLTVVRAIAERMPPERIIYLGDDARGPYGPRKLEEVRRFTDEIADYLLGFDVKMIVVACNTATASALPVLQGKYEIPVVGVIAPGVKAALLKTANERIGVIGTEGTISSGAYERELKFRNPNVQVYSQACPEFVEFVEQKEVHGSQIYEIAKGYLVPMVDWGMDTLILGCTHYPLLEDLIEEVVGPGIELVSSADEVAMAVRDLLELLGWRASSKREGELTLLTTGDPERSGQLGRMFFEPEVCNVIHVDLDKPLRLEEVAP